ncbi:Transmembrane channel-like protein 5 [Zootermopsis nevadensis]|uniref:Transmembrane channel-like protein 5 n=1 Tax=Zootermopsis nevadensis TaxID=136037 RepID=A0A067RJ61_ZOONE|nr:Transmembrane channel-like protein 5 [Zootermopsis nevadensis]
MNRSSGYGSREEVRMESLKDAETRRQPVSRRPDQHRRGEQYVAAQHRPASRDPAQYQFDPRNNRSPARPSISRSQPQHRPTPSQEDVIRDLPLQNIGDVSFREGILNQPLLFPGENKRLEEHHVAQIVNEMEQDVALMEDNPLSEQLRMEALREMPESLTLKRTVKKKLVKSVSQKSKRTPLSIWKRLKYRLSVLLSKFSIMIKNLLYTFELWYSSLKVIEGHFGSGVATYFRFLRWLFLLNTVVFLLSFGFVVIPQLLHRFYEPAEGNQNGTESTPSQMNSVIFDSGHSDGFLQLHEEYNSTIHLVTPVAIIDNWKPAPSVAYQSQVRSRPYASNADFSVGNIFTGEGFFTDTTLYYGYYTNESVSVVSGLTYHIPSAYFFTVLSCYLFMFVVLSISMARSYRRTFIETAGGLKNVVTHKVFCGWDFSIATGEAAALKSKSIYNELKELLEDMKKEDKELTCQGKFFLLIVRIFLNVFIGLVLASTGLIIWFLLREEIGVDEPAAAERGAAMLMPLIITVIMMAAPVLFSWMARVEDYASPRTALFVTLTRTFVMEIVVIGVVVAFWLTFKKNSECWETSLGQEIYRLVITDFLLAIVGTSLAEFVRFRIYKSMWKKIGGPEFHIARNTLNVIYNQTLFFVGLYFSPLLSFIIILKMFITFYVKKIGLLNSCQPSARPWRAAQTHTLFLVLSFIATLAVLILLGYIITQVESSSCGPFCAHKYPYEMILDMLQVQENNGFLQFVRFLVKPGVIGGILLAMCVGVYFLRAKSYEHRDMVLLLKEMLVLEAKDKEFLLDNISKVTNGRWDFNLRTDRSLGAKWNLQKQVRKRADIYSNTLSDASTSREYDLSEYERPVFQRGVRERRTALC